jgi:diguanylate cyclase (GGDEF)-like protein
VDCVLLVIVLAALALAEHVLGRGTPAALLLFGLGETVAALATGIAFAQGTRGSPGWLRGSRLLFAAACLAWGVGQGIFAVLDVLALRDGVTTWADGPFLAFAALSVGSAVVHLRGRVPTDTGLRAALDGTLLGLSLFTVVWVLWLGVAVRAADTPARDLVVPMTYPVLDVVFLTVVTITVLRGGTTVPGLLVLAGGAAFAFADATYFYAVLGEGFQTGGAADFGWILAFGLFTVAARYRRTTRDPRRSPSAGSWGRLVPYVALLPATVFASTRLWNSIDRVVLTNLLVMTLLVMVRQFLTLQDHRRLLATAERQREQLDLLAHVDPLTGLENRRRFSERLADAVRGSLVTGVPVVVAFVDLDGFKTVNDTLGHAAGDELLRGVAGRLSGCVREGDGAARWGGDEFAVLVTDPDLEAADVVERLRLALLEPFLLAGTPLIATASIGAVREDPRRMVADLPASSADAVDEVVEGLLAAADAEMYLVKRARRGPGPAEG